MNGAPTKSKWCSLAMEKEKPVFYACYMNAYKALMSLIWSLGKTLPRSRDPNLVFLGRRRINWCPPLDVTESSSIQSGSVASFVRVIDWAIRSVMGLWSGHLFPWKCETCFRLVSEIICPLELKTINKKKQKNGGSSLTMESLVRPGVIKWRDLTFWLNIFLGKKISVCWNFDKARQSLQLEGVFSCVQFLPFLPFRCPHKKWMWRQRSLFFLHKGEDVLKLRGWWTRARESKRSYSHTTI